jgi:hypothetical protein
MKNNLYRLIGKVSVGRNEKEEMPPKMPKAPGDSARISCFVDADQAGNVATRRSLMGISVFVNDVLISWFPKRQNTVECSTFGSGFVTLRANVWSSDRWASGCLL